MTLPAATAHGLLSPFVESKPRLERHITMTTTPSSVNSFYDTASSLRHCISRRSIRTNECFCGFAAVRNVTEDEDNESAIYCSAECARQDALTALTYRSNSFAETLQFETPSTSSSASSLPRAVLLGGEDGWQDNAVRAGLALQHSIDAGPISHYQRMEKAAQEEYAFDIVDDLLQGSPSRSRSPSSASTSSTDSVGTAEALTIKPIVQQQHIISLPATPSMDVDDHEAELQRQRQDAIEREIAELDMSLRKELEAFDAHNDLLRIRQSALFDVEVDSCFESDLICGPRSPALLDYEAPLGWRRGPKVYSTNFLGLQLNSPYVAPDCADEDADKARLQRLHDALDQSFGELTSSMQFDGLCERSAVPEHPLTRLHAANVQFINPFHAVAESTAMARTASCDSSSASTACVSPRKRSMRVPERKSSLTVLRADFPSPANSEKYPLPRSRLLSFPSKQNLANFFNRRPSHSTLMTQSGIGSADMALTPNLVRTVPTRYIPLPRSLRS